SEAINAAMAASDEGDIIFFPAGTYKLVIVSNGDRITPLGGGRIYMGTPGTTLFTTSTLNDSSDRAFFNLNSSDCDNIQFTDITFFGAGIYADSQVVDGLVVTDCSFDVTDPEGYVGNSSSFGIQWSTYGVKDSIIINNVFASSARQGIYGDA